MKIISHGHAQPSSPPSSSEALSSQLRSELEGFELGRFLKSNLGLNGFWTSYVLLHPDKGRISQKSSDGSQIGELEGWMLDRCPIFLATQERFRIFRRLTQPLVHSEMRLASIPSGLMDDLLTLDYSGSQDVTVTAVDLDPASLEYARANFDKLGTPVRVEFEQRDAWNLGAVGRWDLVTSNGLNIYIEDDGRCVEFYRSIAEALRPDGFFVMSFITPPESWRPYVLSDLERQRHLFREVLPVKWQCVRDEALTRSQLEEAGFEVRTIEYDAQRMFPAVVAQKRRG
jgi:SAM-dependent methyltransferase